MRHTNKRLTVGRRFHRWMLAGGMLFFVAGAGSAGAKKSSFGGKQLIEKQTKTKQIQHNNTAIECLIHCTYIRINLKSAHQRV